MALKLLWDDYQTYNVSHITFPFTASIVQLDSGTSATTYNLTLNNVQSVLLVPDINYANELNQSGVGGVYTTLTVKPTASGAITGSAVTETVAVGSFAYLSNFLSISQNLLNYVNGNPTTANETAISSIDTDLGKLLQGSSPGPISSSISQAITSADDSNFTSIAEPLVALADNWDVPVYTLTTSAGTTPETGLDPAAFGVDLLTVDGASSTWNVNGSQGGIIVSGYTAYSTYNATNNTSTIDVVDADTDGELDIASSGGTSQLPQRVLGQTALPFVGTVSPLGNGGFLLSSSSQAQLFGANGVATGSAQPLGISGAVEQVQTAAGNYLTVSNVEASANDFFHQYVTYSISTDLSDTVVFGSGDVLAPSQYQNSVLGGVAITPDGGFVIGTLLLSYNSTQALIGTSEDVFGYNAAGVEIWGSSVAGSTVPVVTVLANGNIAVANGVAASGGGQNVQVTVDSSAGQPISLTVLPVESVSDPSIAGLKNGDFVVAWDDGTSIESQLFDRAGNAIGSPFQVSPNGEKTDFNATDTEIPAVAGLSNGDFVEVWSAVTGTTNGEPDSELRGQIFDAEGNAIGSNFNISDGANLQVISPTVISLAGGNFLVSWVQSSTAGVTGASGEQEEIFTPPATVNLAAVVSDFNGDGTSDVLFRDNATGDTGFYAINNGANAGWHDLGASSTAYGIVGAGDFYGYGTSDVLYRNAATGDTGLYQIVNGANLGWHDIGASSTAYNVIGIGDFTGGSIDDVLYRNNATGDTGFYEIVNGANTGWRDIGASSTAYSVVGVGDFMGNGTDDVLYRNNATGDTGFYEIVDGFNKGWHDVGASSTAYSVVGVGDFMGNGTDDILYRDNTTGDTGFYEMVNGVNTGWHDIGASSTAYTVVAIGNYLGNGTSDVLFRNNTTGDTGFYALNNGVNIGWHDFGVSSTAYHVAS